MANSLLPPNATGLERALESAIAQISDVEIPIAQLVDPATIKFEWLPWLAWGLSVDTWDADWTEAAKRQAVAESIMLHRLKGTRLSVESVVSRFDDLIELVEWHEASPRGEPHTFDVIVPWVTGAGVAPGGRRSTAAFAEAVAREVARVQPLREHLRMVQSIAAAGMVGVRGVARATNYVREDAALTIDESPDWAAYLQTEDGEPLQDSASAFLDTRL
jgi:phage tail P2-like protein